MIKKLTLSVLAGGAVAAALCTPAMASGGCGPYRHPTIWGDCRPPGEWGWPPGEWGGGGVFLGGPAYLAPRVGWGYGGGWHRPWGWRGGGWGWHGGGWGWHGGGGWHRWHHWG